LRLVHFLAGRFGATGDEQQQTDEREPAEHAP
jgi:hypothetical protein